MALLRPAAPLALAGLLLACARQDPPGAAPDDEAPVSSEVVVAAPLPPPRRLASASASAPASPPAALTAGELPIGPEYEVPEEGGVVVAAIARPVWIHDGPDTSFKRLGYLQPGMTLRRAERPVAVTPRCRKGWFRVAPRGFLCMNPLDVTTDLQHPVVVAYVHQARRGEPLPYLYGRVQSSLAFQYVKTPSLREQHQLEGDGLNEHLTRASGYGLRFLSGPPEPLPPFLQNNRVLPRAQNVGHRSRNGLHRGPAAAKSSFAFFSVHDVQGRLFGLSTNLDLVPLDRLKLAAVSPIHGGPVDDLPAAVVQRGGAPRYRLDPDRGLVADGTFNPYETLSLTGLERDDMSETRDGAWVPTKAAYHFKKRPAWPGFLKETDEMKWIDVHLRDQTLVAYEGHRAVFVTRVSTGAGGDADPETSHATIKGMYRIQAKHVTATMAGDQGEDTYEIADVPYVQYFHHDYALHGAFWHEGFGTPRSHGCINLAPRDAAWLFEWTDTKLPAEWHGIETNGEGTLVFIH